MPDPLPPTGPTDVNQPPTHVPEAFWDPVTQSIRIDALLEAYHALQAEASQRSPLPGADRADTSAIAAPESSDGYAIRCDHGLFDPDPEINTRLHQAGFTADQAQLLYDLAAERFLPLIQEIASGYEAERQLQRLVDHFGGEDRWRDVSRQMLTWAGKNLPPAAVEGLTTTAEGVLALNRLMTAGEPVTLRDGRGRTADVSEQDLYGLMRDPRYWRDRNPEVVARVTQGFERLYPRH